jgi:para-aminobenzoate synthetase component 1
LKENKKFDVTIEAVKKIDISADRLVAALVNLPEDFRVSLLDSCRVPYLGSRYLAAGVRPVETFYLTDENPHNALALLDKKLAGNEFFKFFTLSYDFGLKLQNIRPRKKEFPAVAEPDVYLALYDAVIVHDYRTGETFLAGNPKRFGEIASLLESAKSEANERAVEKSLISSNFTKESYIRAVEKIHEFIRRGDTYQTNLTQQFRARLAGDLSAGKVFLRLRAGNPAPFAAFLRRGATDVVSISPERFFRISGGRIETSPIKGTRPRGQTGAEDERLKQELLTSAKDRAENTMIVDLLRNDIGRVCRFGSVRVDRLCDLETHPTYFHLVSTVSGELREDAAFSDILRAVFPCGSITGAPKISTMRIIDRLETADRGLSMGAIGYSFPNELLENGKFEMQNSFDLNVAIRTMVVKDREAFFNVGGGVVIDSSPEGEYEETLVKARAIFRALGADEKDLPK